MSTLTYDEDKTIHLLSQLPPKCRVVFALLCAQRILPCYRRFCMATGRGEPDALESIADRLWLDMLGKELTAGELNALLIRVMELIPAEDAEDWHEETQPYAEDASTALTYALRVRLTSDPQEAAWAARCVYEAIDNFVQETSATTPGSVSNHEMAILSNPLVQAELARQRRDLDDLIALKTSDSISSSFSALRLRSEKEAENLFQL